MAIGDWLVKRISALTRTATDANLTDSEYMAVDNASAYTRKITVASFATWILNKIRSMGTIITTFRVGDVIPVDGPSGLANMSKDNLLKETAQNALAGNFAPAFDPTRTSENPYEAGDIVIYNGESRRFLRDLYGDWIDAYSEKVNLSEIVNIPFQRLFTRLGLNTRRFGMKSDETYYFYVSNPTYGDKIILDTTNNQEVYLSGKLTKFIPEEDCSVITVSHISDINAICGVTKSTDVGNVDLSFQLADSKSRQSQFDFTPYFENGSLTPGPVDTLNVIRSKGYFTSTKNKICIYFNSSLYNIRIVEYSDYGTSSNLTNYSASPINHDIQQGLKFRIVISHKKTSAFLVSELPLVNLDIDGISLQDFIPYIQGKFSNLNDYNYFELLRSFWGNLEFEQGSIGSDGILTDESNTNYNKRIRSSRYFIGNGELLTFTRRSTGSCYLAHYNEYGIFIETIGTTASPISEVQTIKNHLYKIIIFTPAGRDISPNDWMELYPYIDNLQSISNLYPANLVTFRNKLAGKKISFIGDSITAATALPNQDVNLTYASKLCQKYGAICNTLAVGGTCIANNTTNGKSNNRFVTRATQENLEGSSLIVVFGGTNDFSYDSKAIGPLFDEATITPSDRIGSKKIIPISDTDTFAGGLHDLILTITQNCPGVPIVFMTPTHRGRYIAGRPTSEESNANGNFMYEFVDAIKQICSFYAIPVLDLYSNGVMNPLHGWSSYFSDNLHPNDLGNRYLAEILFNFIENNITIN